MNQDTTQNPSPNQDDAIHPDASHSAQAADPTHTPSESTAAASTQADGKHDGEHPEASDAQELQAQIAELQAKNAELAEQYLRAQADVQNMRRRTDEDMSKARKFAIESFAESLLPVLDSFEAGLAVENATLEQIREGSDATLKQLKSALERNKVLEINPAPKDKFDPHMHQAISAVAQEGFEANTIVAVLQKGYQIADRILRPALVTVAQS